MRYSLLALLGMVLASGCGGPETPQPVPVNGLVRWKGEPMTVGRVQFVPDSADSGRTATGDVDSDGIYRLSTYKTGDGALPGRYKVQVFPFDYNAEPVVASAHTVDIYAQVPKRYQDPVTSGLIAEVEDAPSGQTIDFDLDD